MRKEEKAPEGPQRIGPYQVVTLVYRSPFNEVYCCREVRLDRNVAVKVTRLDDANRATASSRLRREALIRSTIEHANILPLDRAVRRRWDLTWRGLGPLGGTLLDRYGSLRPEAYVSLTREIGSALDRLHSAGWIHGDLNGRNIVFGGDGRAVLIDFGSVRHIGSRNGGETGLDITPEVVPPEVWRGEPADGRSDLYGLGVLLYRSMTGRYPFQGDAVAVLPRAALRFSRAFPSLRSRIRPLGRESSRCSYGLWRRILRSASGRGRKMAAELSRAVAADAGLKEDGSAARSQSLPRAGGARLEPGLGAETVRAAGAQLERFAGNLSDREQEALRALLNWLQEARAKATSEVSALTTKLFAVPAALLALEQIGASEVLADGATTPEELAAACGAPRSTTTCLLEVSPPPNCSGRGPILPAASARSALPDWKAPGDSQPADSGGGRLLELAAGLGAHPPALPRHGPPGRVRLLPGCRVAGQSRRGAGAPARRLPAIFRSTAAGRGDPRCRRGLGGLEPRGRGRRSRGYRNGGRPPRGIEIARARAESAGLGARFESLEGDWRTVPLPSEAFDLVLVANLCHLEPGEEVAVLLRRLRPPLRPGGLLVIVDTIPEREEAPLTILLTGLRLALRTPRGGIHDLESYRRWLKAAAFSVQELLPLLPDEHFFALIACPSPRD